MSAWLASDGLAQTTAYHPGYGHPALRQSGGGIRHFSAMATLPTPMSPIEAATAVAAASGKVTKGRRVQEAPGYVAALRHAARIYGIQSYVRPMLWLRDWSDYFYPQEGRPNMSKTYECRPGMPVWIFFPKKYDLTSAETLPLVFTIHGGGFCLGSSRDDDAWNRHLANSKSVMVVALDYRKAPWHPFPTGLHDIEELMLAVLDDESLPIDRRRSPGKNGSKQGRSRVAVVGFSAGGNLALAACQLPRVRDHPLTPSAAISVYGSLDMSVSPTEKIPCRHYKTTLGPPRGAWFDALSTIAPTFDWSYIPYGHDLRDPLLSPVFASREQLPEFVAVVAAELDMLAHESWTLACRLANETDDDPDTPKRHVPARDDPDKDYRIPGRPDPGRKHGCLEGVGSIAQPDERFAFEVESSDGKRGVKWLLVPDVIHGFDSPSLRHLMGGNVLTHRDAQMKTMAYVKEIGRWLQDTVWEI